MKWIFTILIFLLLTTTAYAEVVFKEVFYSEVDNNADFEADDKIFHVQAFSKLRARIEFPAGTSRILYIGDCVSAEGYLLCLLRIKSGEDYELTAANMNQYFNITTQQYKLFPQIKIQRPDSQIEMTRTFEETTFMVGNKIRVDVTISNTGSTSLSGITYVDEYPWKVEIVDTIDSRKKGNKTIWEGPLGIGKEKKFFYYIKGKQGVEFTSSATLTHESANLTDSQKITIQEPQLTANTYFSSKELDLGEETIMTISLENNNEKQDITNLKYKIYFPDGLKKIFKTGDISQERDYYIHNKPLEASEKRNITITLRAEKLGTLPIREEIEYTGYKIKYESSYVYNISVSTKELKVNIDKNVDLIPGKSVEMPLYVINPNDRQTFRGIDIKIETNLPIKNIGAGIPEIKPHETIEAMMLIFVVPDDNDTTYKVDVSMSYSTYYNELLTKKESIVIIEKTKADTQPVSGGKQTNRSQTAPGINQDKFRKGMSRMVWMVTEENFRKIMGMVALTAIITLAILIVYLKRKKTIEDRLNK